MPSSSPGAPDPGPSRHVAGQGMNAAAPPPVTGSIPLPAHPATPPASRRGFLGLLTWLMGLGAAAVLAVPGVGYLLTPILRSKQGEGEFVPVARLSDLEPDVPRVFPIVQRRKDAWVSYPAEPVGSVWLVRQPEGKTPAVLAFSAECPHLACAITLGDDRGGFFCPCHVSSFQLDGRRIRGASPRDMDSLEVMPLPGDEPDPVIRVRFQRFRSNTEAKVPLA